MVLISSGHCVRMAVILLLVLKNIEAYRSWGIKEVVGGDGHEVLVPGRIDMNTGKDRKEIFDAVPTAVEERSSKIGGRKIRMQRRQLREEIKKEECEISEESSRISGRNDIPTVSEKTIGDSVKNKHVQFEQLKANSQSNANSEASVTRQIEVLNIEKEDCAADSTRCSLKCSSGLKNLVPRKYDHGSFQKLESEKLLEAATQIVNLMNKDYPGKGVGHHNPPVNNHEPLHR